MITLKTKPRNNFYENEINMERVREFLKVTISHLNLTEILKMIREISYDMVCYYGDNDDQKGIIHREKYNYSQINKEQAAALQKRLRDICDLFNQSVIQKHIFDDDYLSRYNLFYELTSKNKAYEEEIEVLKDRIKYLEEAL